MTARDRLAVHADGIDLGPAEPHEWLCGFVYRDPTPSQRIQLKGLARRIAEFEPVALALLCPVDADEDWPENIRHRGGIVLHQLGRHSGAARWAIRGAALRGWQACREDVPTKKERRNRLATTQRSVEALVQDLRRLNPRDRMALQAAGLIGGSAMLPAHPEDDGPGWLVTNLRALDDSIAAEVARLGQPSDGDWVTDWSAGDPLNRNAATRIADDAVEIWVHFRPDRKPTATPAGPFEQLVRTINNMAREKTEDLRRSVKAALKANRERIVRQYGTPIGT
jgi:hypothetical protein